MILEIFLFVCVSGSQAGTPNFLCQKHAMPSMEVCERAAGTFEVSRDTSGAGNAVFAYCGSKNQW
jgi:hypothetical protein